MLRICQYFICFSFTWLFTLQAHAQHPVINEFSSSNDDWVFDEDFDSPNWIEIYNPTNSPVNLEGYGLSDNAQQPYRWVFPDTTLEAQSYLLVWASNKNRKKVGQPLHTNFSIDQEGEELLLSAPGGVRLDTVPPTALQRNVSFGRYPNGSSQWHFFYQPTPNGPNNDNGRASIFTPPQLSHPAGMYVFDFGLTLSHPDTGVTIVYTLDGSEPDINNTSGTTFMYKNDYPFDIGDPFGDTLYSTFSSHIYNGAIHIYDRSTDSNYFSNFNTRQMPMEYPLGPVPKGTVIRAKAYKSGLESTEVSASYFVWPQGNPFDIPVISLKIQHDYLFDYYTGIYTAGVTFDNWRLYNPNNSNSDNRRHGNYWRRGPAWEYPLHVEFFEPNNFSQVINQNAGFRIHGNHSRRKVIKNLRLYARNMYDEKNEFEHDLFDEKVTDSRNPENTKYKRIFLRGDGAGGPIYNDVVFNRLMQPLFKGVTRIKPAVHFINGEYWGVTAIRDRYDQFHWTTNYNISEDNILVIKCHSADCHVDAGDSIDIAEFRTFTRYMNNNDLSIKANYEYVTKKLCTTSFIDHMILQIYSGNTHYERSFWKAREYENPEFGDGKWRIHMQDFDQTLRGSGRNWLSYWAERQSPYNGVFRNLLDNENFKRDFINRFADLLNTAYLPSRFTAITDSVLAEVKPYLELDSIRAPGRGLYLESERQDLLDWGNVNHDRQKTQISNHFNLSGTYEVTLDVSDTAHGYIKINTIDILPSTVGVPEDAYPWKGEYFNDIPIQLTAKAKPGYEFSHWTGSDVGNKDNITLKRSSNLNIQAHFKAKSNPREVIYFWLFDNRITNNTPLDSVASTFENTGQDGVMHFNSCFSGYPYSINHPNWRKGSMERRSQSTPINYRPAANHDIEFGDAQMRGIQLRQPFVHNNEMSNVVLDIPTNESCDIKLSFAANTELKKGCYIHVAYWAYGQWNTAGLPQDSFYIDQSYRLCEVDFSSIKEANNNPFFKVKMRFSGEQMEDDNGDRIHLNNIAVEGSPLLNTHDKNDTPLTNIYPNPTDGEFFVESLEPIKEIVLYNMHGQRIRSKSGIGFNIEIDTDGMPPAVYLLRIIWENGSEKTVRLVVL